jgi:ABC-type uncharacterized transport system substrate-binding protein
LGEDEARKYQIKEMITMSKKYLIGYGKIVVLAVMVLMIGGSFLSRDVFSESQGKPKKFKILHVMSYHSPWKWTDDQFNGFKDALKGLDIEYKAFQMDTKRKSSEEWKKEAGRQARALIDTWKPDLVYTNDDNAQIYVTKYYVNKSTPFVFSAVNADPGNYGFIDSKNIAGVLEQEHFVESVRLLKEIAPNVSKIAVITDDDPTWPEVLKRMKEKAPKELRDVKFVSWDVISRFDEYKRKIKSYENKVDAVCLLGIFTFRDEKGNNVPFEEVAKWTADNSKLPDFSFWKDRIGKGTLCTVTVSGYEQGLAAGKIARGILVEGRSPFSYPFKPTLKGEPVVSLARAEKLGIKIKSSLLLNAVVVKNFEWDK